MIKLYLFDMDFTLTNADCDITWKSFLIQHDLASPDTQEIADGFLRDYDNGVLDVAKFNAFQLREFKGKTQREIVELSQAHFEEQIKPLIRPKAFNYVQNVISQHLPLGIISSTNSELVKPVAQYFGIENLYCTELEYDHQGRATGKITGTYAAGPGKVVMLNKVLKIHGIAAQDTAYFGDSTNDEPILETVGHPFAVNPSEKLKLRAQRSNWPILDWNN